MKAFLMLGLMFALACASNALDVVTKSGKLYSGAKVTRVEKDGVGIMHRDGTAFVDFDDLPLQLQKQYGWTDEKSTARKAQREAERQRQITAQLAAREQQEKDKAIREAQERERAADARRKVEMEAQNKADDEARFLAKQNSARRAAMMPFYISLAAVGAVLVFFFSPPGRRWRAKNQLGLAVLVLIVFTLMLLSTCSIRVYLR